MKMVDYIILVLFGIAVYKFHKEIDKDIFN